VREFSVTQGAPIGNDDSGEDDSVVAPVLLRSGASEVQFAAHRDPVMIFLSRLVIGQAPNAVLLSVHHKKGKGRIFSQS
jgi:hypothetical protein